MSPWSKLAHRYRSNGARYRRDGPLTATFSTRVNARGEHQQMVCTITDPSLGSFTVPGERTADWNLEMGDFHQLNLNWVVDGRYFDGDDSGSWQRLLAVLLRLTANVSAPAVARLFLHSLLSGRPRANRTGAQVMTTCGQYSRPKKMILEGESGSRSRAERAS